MKGISKFVVSMTTKFFVLDLDFDLVLVVALVVMLGGANHQFNKLLRVIPPYGTLNHQCILFLDFLLYA
jgi:hypothetical protein